jgi:magnesium transporter
MSLKHQLTQSTFESILTENDLVEGRKTSPVGTWTCYSKAEVRRTLITSASELTEPAPDEIRWLHWSGFDNTRELASLSNHFGIDPLMAEDILNPESRSKLEETSDSVFVVLKIPVAMDAEGEIEIIHFCLLLQKGVVLTFSEVPIKFLDDLFRRLDDKKRKIRSLEADYLCWAILDLLMDHSLRFVDHLSDRVEKIEDELIEDTSDVEMETIHGTKNEVSHTYRLLRPVRQISSQLCNSDSDLFSTRSARYFQDLYDHAVQAVERVDHLRDKAASLRELYYTMMSHRMNQVMKVLTSLSAIFLPLTFLAGVYGMNFAYMPELGWKWSYPIFLGVLISIGTALVVYFKRKRWL